MPFLKQHIKHRRQTYVEVAIFIVLIIGAYIFLRYQETNLEVYFAEKFPSQGLVLGQVMKIEPSTGTPASYLVQDITVKFLTGEHKGEETVTRNQLSSTSTANKALELVPGEKVLLTQSSDFTNQPYYITDRYRLPALLLIVLIFVATAVIFGRIRGLTSILGLAASILILGYFAVPLILAGYNPLLICLCSAILIAVVSLYFAHGFNKRTTVALCGTVLSLAVSAGLSVLFVSATKLVGLTSDQSFYLGIGKGVSLDLRGLLLGGIIIGALGVLDDVTIGQTATVYELKDANPAMTTKELYSRGMSIGREHIASLINTLFLAYAGIGLPTILYLSAFQSELPLWLTLNSEIIAEEIVRTMVGSIGIILAVPITTLLAAYFFGKPKK
jgi:uncharacterized membrane protein